MEGISMWLFRKRSARTGIECASCKKINAKRYKYCWHCGLPLDSTERPLDENVAKEITRVLTREYGDRELVEWQVKSKAKGQLFAFFVAPVGIILTILAFIGFKSYNDILNAATSQIRHENAVIAIDTTQAIATYTAFTNKIGGLSDSASRAYALAYDVGGNLAVVANSIYHYAGQFNSPHLASTWQWTHGKPRSSLTDRPGWLRIYTQKNKDLAKTTNASLLLQKAPTGNFAIATYVQISSTKNFQQAGIVIYGNDHNFCKVVYVPHKNLNTLELGCQGNGKFDYRFQVAIPPTSIPGYFLQLDKRDEIYTGYDSTDGLRWTEVNSSTNLKYAPAVAPVSIGLLAVNGAVSNGADPTAPTIPADFHFFQMRPLPAGTPGPLSVVPVNQ
jgi:Beta xylosidase C-terminal Concanavalin A-like domain